MRRLILHVIVMMVTFSAGFGLNELISWLGSEQPQTTASNAMPQQLEPQSETITPPVPATPVAPVVETPPNVILDFDTEKFDPFGDYSPIGTQSKEFRDFASFSFWADNYDGQLTGYVQVQIKSGDLYVYPSAAFGLVTKQRVFFVVPKVNDENVGYRFDGKFVRHNFQHLNENTPVLEGTLTKTRNGRKVAEQFVRFSLSYDMC